MSVRKIFDDLKRQKRAAFIPYLTVGDPTVAGTEQIVKALIQEGADMIELGVPFSDPVADGVINQRSAERALKHGTSLKEVLDLVTLLRREGIKTPLILFTYFNPILKMGIDTFARKAETAGVDAVLVVDLPPEEAEDYQRILQSSNIECIFLASPTTRKDRLPLIDRFSTGFIYYVSRTGVTGTQSQVSSSLEEEVTQVRKSIRGPLGIGFGISTPEQAKLIARIGDGVIIGSAIVRMIEESTSVENAVTKVREFARKIVSAIREVEK